MEWRNNIGEEKERTKVIEERINVKKRTPNRHEELAIIDIHL